MGTGSKFRNIFFKKETINVFISILYIADNQLFLSTNFFISTGNASEKIHNS